MKYLYLSIIILVVVIIVIFIINKIYLWSQKCVAYSNYISVNSSDTNENISIISRYTKKMVINTDNTNQLLTQMVNINNLLIPSMINGSYCDTNYSTYYNIDKMYLDKYKLKKCKIRIRKYQFSPGLFLEFKNNHAKIRTQIDNDYNIINLSNNYDKYYIILNDLLQLIKTQKIKILCKTKYKRFSFVYQDDNRIRITLDKDIVYEKNGDEKNYPNLNILEIKYPTDYSESTISEIINKFRKLGFYSTDISKSLLDNYYKTEIP